MKSLMTILCMFVMTWCCHAQSADTIRFVYASSKEDSALYTFTSSSHLIRFQKGKKVLKKHLDIPMIVDGQSRYHFRMMGNQPVGLLEADRRLATFYADSIFTSEGKYKIVEYSHLKWSYRLIGSEVLVCRYFSEKSIKNLVLEFSGESNGKTPTNVAGR